MTRVTWRGIATDAESAECWEAAATDPELDDVLIRPIPGYGSYRSNAASAGTDSGGGHVDLDFVGLTDEQCRRVETVYRRYGNFAAWRPERRPDGTRYGWQNHGHVLRMDCADLAAPGRTQLGDYRAGYNGLPIGGRVNKDTGDRRYLAARWLTIKAQQEDDDVELSDMVGITPYVRRVTGTTETERAVANVLQYGMAGFYVGRQVQAQVATLAGQLAGLTEAVRQLARGEVDLPAITAAADAGARAGVAEALAAGLELEVSVRGEGS